MSWDIASSAVLDSMNSAAADSRSPGLYYYEWKIKESGDWEMSPRNEPQRARTLREKNTLF
jgi:hypothetical protein